MKAKLVSLFLIVASVHATAQLNDDFTMPKIWANDFTIVLSFGGSMDGSSTLLTFTHDTCTYVKKIGMKAPKTTKHLLLEADRTVILKKLEELKVANIHSEMSIAPVNDGWSTSMCFGSHCVSGGTSTEMSAHDKDVYAEAFNFLELFAIQKGRQKK
ncbi:hypothetical protein [Chryseolinea lacunae]|uniref:Uncharacterized protein n=1 Tax=Chryseolinea lacunae TaxID=2801331 RepID=A0ABS1KPU6_9BACT|nr:hypothetical protein [Chryseolinea lacunae]MBL0741446.1 hypothetical protein [Chryseolinea lacunae]